MRRNEVRRWITPALGVSLVGLVGGLGGCVSYYRVTDNTSGEVYYTQKQDMADQQGGELKFRDAQTGSTITLTDPSVEQISPDEFRGATSR